MYEQIAIITQIWHFYMHQRHMVSAHDIQYEVHLSSHHGGMHEDGLTERQMD